MDPLLQDGRDRRRCQAAVSPPRAAGGAAGGAVGAFAGPLVSVEALACAKQLLNMLGSTTTKACTDLSADLRAGYTLNTTLVGIEHADALLLVTPPRIRRMHRIRRRIGRRGR